MTDQATPTAAVIAKLGGVATAQAPDTVAMQAITYTSPALPDRVVVRLAPAPLAVVEDLTAETFGMTNAGATEVGYTRARATGFPAWPIMHDPDNARHALNLVGALQRAGRQIRSKPGAAKDEITKIGADLGKSAPHFLPTFYEEAARLFLAAGNQTYATQFVGKAREAERVHGLAVDEQRHQAVMLEFALDGAVSAKELTAEAKSLPGRVGPDEAYALFLRLNVERVLGGMPPYAGVLVDLRKLGNAAGKKPAETDHDFLGQVISAQSLRQAAGAFWEKAGPALKKLVEQDEAVASGLLSFLPAKVKVAAWVTVLSELGLLDRLAADPPTARAWLQLMMDQVSMRWEGDSESLAPLILGWRHVLAGATFSCSDRLALDTMDALLEVGAEVELRGGGLDLRAWANNPSRSDLTFVAAHPRLRAAITAPSWVPDNLAGIAAAHPGAREIVRSWLQAARDEGGRTLGGLERRLHYAPWATAETYPVWRAEFDALYTGLDVPEIVADNLRLGLTTELTQPLVEQTIAEMRTAGTKNDRWPTVADQWPAVAVFCDNRVRFIERDEVVAAHDFPADVDIEAAELVGDEIGIMSLDASYDSVRMWAGSSATQKLVGYYRGGAESSLPVPAGRLYPSGLVTPGGKAYHNTGHNGEVLSDGTHHWRLHSDCVELDPETGREGRQSLPEPLAAALEHHGPDGFALGIGASTYRPVSPATADSLMSTADGMHSCIVLVQPRLYGTAAEQRIIDADGTLYSWTPQGRSFAGPVWGVIRRPGGGVWFVDADGTLIDAETGLYLQPALTADADNHLLTQLPRHVWHHLRARDEGASKRLRRLTAADVEALVEAVSVVPAPADLPRRTFWEPAYVYEVALPGSPAMATAAQLLGVDATDTRMHPLLTSVVMVAVDALQSVRQAAEIAGRAGGDPDPDEVLDLPALNKVVAPYRPQFSRGSLQRVVRAIEDGSVPRESLDVAQIIGWESALVALAAAPLRPVAERTQLARLGVALGEEGFLTPGFGSVVVPGLTSGTEGTWFTTHADGSGQRLLRIGAGYDYSVVMFAGEAPTTVHGLPVSVASGERPDPDALMGVFLHLRDTDEALEWNPAWARDLAAATGLSEAAAAVLLMGLPQLGAYEQNFLPTDVRALLGLKVTEADLARTELRALPIQHLIALLAAGVPLADPASYLTSGPDIAAMADMWRKLQGERRALPAEVVAEVTKAFREWGIEKVPELLQEVPDARTFETPQAHLQPAFLAAMAERLPLDDPLRAWLADRFEQLAVAFVATPLVEAAYCYGPQVLATLGLPEPADRTVAERHEVDGLVLNCQYGRIEVLYSPAEALKHPEVLPRLESLPVDVPNVLRRTLRLHEFLTGDAVAEAVAWLRTTGTGSPRDPLAVVPEVVEQTAAGLGVPAESARYWLQLAALPNPADRVVQAANGWTKAARTAAAAPLLEQGLIIEAKRARAGRTLFLPGGWQEASAPHPPMEVWKAPFFDLDDTPKVSPLFGSVIYLGAMLTLFTDAWQRCADGDAPGYEELRTQPYRRRRRR